MRTERYSKGQKSSTEITLVYFSFKLAARWAKPECHLSFGGGIWRLLQSDTLKQAEEEPGTKTLKGKWATKYEISQGGATHHRVGVSITASAYKRLGNEAAAVPPGSNHADLSISSMHYSLRTAILPPSVAGKDWFRFLFICFSSPPIRSLLLPFCSFSIKLRRARH